MPFVFHSYVLVCHPYVTRLYSYVIRMSLVYTRMSSVSYSYVLVCTHMLSVCHSHVLVCHSYVTRTYLYIIRMLLLCTRMSSVCHSYALICHPYVTRMYPYVIRISLVCAFTMNPTQSSRVKRPKTQLPQRAPSQMIQMGLTGNVTQASWRTMLPKWRKEHLYANWWAMAQNQAQF